MEGPGIYHVVEDEISLLVQDFVVEAVMGCWKGGDLKTVLRW